MRITIYLLVISFLIAFSACGDCGNCNEENIFDLDFQTSDALITGYDPRFCYCCGGWWVELNKDTMRTWNMPDEFRSILMEEKMPVPVRLQWKDMEEGCGGDKLIVIKSIEMR